MWRLLEIRYARFDYLCSPEGSSEHKFLKRAYWEIILELLVRRYYGRMTCEFPGVPDHRSSWTGPPSFKPPRLPLPPQLRPQQSPPKEWLLFSINHSLDDSVESREVHSHLLKLSSSLPKKWVRTVSCLTSWPDLGTESFNPWRGWWWICWRWPFFPMNVKNLSYFN